MNWYKRSQRLYPSAIPDNREFEYLTGKDPDESGSKPRTTYQPGMRRLPFDVPGEIDPYALYIMDLKSEISAVEESIESYKEELKNSRHSTRSKKILFDDRRDRKRNKLVLQDQIRRLKSLRAKLLRETQKTRTVYPDDFRNFLNRPGGFRNP